MAVLITGVGYLGAALLRRLAERGERVVGLENAYCTPPEALRALESTPGFTLVAGDVADPADVARAFAALPADDPAPPTVFHLAAQPSAAVARADPDYTERTNLVGARRLLEAARARGARVVFGGSFRVYGDDVEGRTLDEDTPYGRMSDLSHLSKLWVEQLARMDSPELGGPFVSVRLGVVYGLGPIVKAEPRFMTVPNVFCQRAARGEVLEVIGDRPIGFIHLDDAVEALLRAPALLEGGEPWQVANAVGEVLTMGVVARAVPRAAGDRGRFVRVHGAHSAAEPARFTVRSRLETEAVGFVPRRRLAEAVGPILDFFLEAERERERATPSTAAAGEQPA